MSPRPQPTAEKKRRGRPPVTEPPALLAPPPRTFIKAAPWDEVGPEPVRVSISMKAQAFGEKAALREVDWPQGWSLPRVGDVVQVEKGVGGFVAHLTFDLDSGRIIVALR